MPHCRRLCIVGWSPTVTDIRFQCAEVTMHVAQNSGMLGERLRLNRVLGCRSVNGVASGGGQKGSRRRLPALVRTGARKYLLFGFLAKLPGDLRINLSSADPDHLKSGFVTLPDSFFLVPMFSNASAR